MAITSTGGVSEAAVAVRRYSATIAFWLLVITLAWAPFPLGSAVAWGPALVALLVAGCWLFWAVSAAFEPHDILVVLKRVWISGVLVLGVLVWAVLQTLPIFPVNWVHPVWSMAASTLGGNLPGVISLNPWRTISEVLKLSSYALAFWLALTLCLRSDWARHCVDAIIAIAVFYALYAYVLALTDETQVGLIFGLPRPHALISGPFMLHNSFATYMGLGTLAAISRLFELASETVVTSRGLRMAVLTGSQFVFGRGALVFAATLLLFSAVAASASRGGFTATMVALLAIATVAALVAGRSASRRWTIIGALVVALPLIALLVLSSGSLGQRLAVLADAGTADSIRLALWDATLRMINTTPWIGLGLGTFQDAYPMYATKVFPYVMDKAHSDYLEFAAGVGLPAAIAWWAALLWLSVLCLRGVFVRRRNRIYPLLGFGASVLVGVHSSADFSLQLPAVGLLYSVMLGIGVAQSQRSRAA